MLRFVSSALAVLALLPSAAFADETLHVHPLSVVPFAALLLSIAVLPLFAGHFWHGNGRKLLVALALSAPVVVYLCALGEAGVHRLVESLLEYVQFVALLAALYTIAGGIALEGDLLPSAKVNVGFVLVGALLANLIGTTGASMLLIRPYLKINARRYSKRHVPVFFIFLVSNLGGLLTPLGDPPLFIGFLRGIDFFWTLSLWPFWLVGVGLVTAVFFVWDSWAMRHEPPHEMENLPGIGPVRLLGWHNFAFIAGILATTLLMSDEIANDLGLPSQQQLAMRLLGRGDANSVAVGVVKAALFVAPLALLGFLSYVTTPPRLRADNDFTWHPILEVVVLFLGIFVTMTPAIVLLEADGAALGIDRPWKFFWATGLLSSFLDNAPTYLTFGTVAAAGQPFASLMNQALVLQAISVGAVFMGANTYIGNGPNFMVKAIADEAGYDTPSFFGYMLYSGAILLPIFVLITFAFFV